MYSKIYSLERKLLDKEKPADLELPRLVKAMEDHFATSREALTNGLKTQADSIRRLESKIEERVRLILGHVQNEVGEADDSRHVQIQHLEAKIDALTRTVETLSQPARFSQFSRLPPEIRIRIWQLSVPRRLVTVVTDNLDSDPRSRFMRVNLSHGPPAVAMVCRESRQEVRRFGARMWPLADTCTGGRLTWTWFDPGRDFLSLDQMSISPNWDVSFWKLLDAVENMVLGKEAYVQSQSDPDDLIQFLCGHTDDITYIFESLCRHTMRHDDSHNNEQPRFTRPAFPALRNLYFTDGPIVNVDKRFGPWTPDVVRRVFQGDEFAIIPNELRPLVQGLRYKGMLTEFKRLSPEEFGPDFGNKTCCRLYDWVLDQLSLPCLLRSIAPPRAPHLVAESIPHIKPKLPNMYLAAVLTLHPGRFKEPLVECETILQFEERD